MTQFAKFEGKVRLIGEPVPMTVRKHFVDGKGRVVCKVQCPLCEAVAEEKARRSAK